MKAKTNPPTTAREPVIKTDSRPMGDGPTLTGLDVLQRNDFRQLKGKRAALLTNHTAINRESVNILDLMTSHPNVKLVALFSPEHGLFGNVDTQVEDFHNTRTGLMVYSLYTARKDPNLKAHHPRPQDLKGIDVVVIDMQDIGARFYTYSGYMGNMMEECGKLGVEVMVLDRPNPIGGLYVDGPLTDDDLVGAVTSYFKMPIAHGMTMGEMAMMFNAENKLGCKLTIVQAQNWTRDMCFDQTGLRWVNPSPNIQDLDAALAYPGIAMTERNVSMGRGTTEPFHLFGTPFIDDPRGMCDEINKSGLVTGARIEAADFTPTGTLARQHIGEGKTCRGGRIIITDRRKFRPVALGVSVMTYLCAKYGEKYVPQKTSAGVKTAPQYDVMQLRGLTSAVLCARIREKVSAENNLKFIDQQVAHFLPIRAKYLLYPEKKP
ncbi:MAG: DUF1343 domain-containing protein [bacterium]|nr:DUF1343 domain-containing protein [Candidatus Sumerlaeota bacterium]